MLRAPEIIADKSYHSAGRFPMRRYPSLVKVAENRWIDEEPAEGVNESHVESRQPTDWGDIDRPEQTIPPGKGYQREHREGVNRSVADFADSLVRMDIEDRERAVRGSWFDE